MTRLVVDICDELWLVVLLHIKGEHKAIPTFVREVLQEYLEEFNGAA